ncbi:MAG TPA: metallophosphoesterase [Elusimicrobia bacterium]|nr:MAG: hypothetical protein A2278_07860 [Elusimicrobia bacterium RIFOXYA12_FULL_49_49]OGS11795.1 MAG: hypothetical protein A2386_02130 [Elusimicrobia bacterium RIFOXYB1_FULL_48_9]OGS16020.1 MAG: hypothetical protein A2251_02405 [Elusimicrobia bacterium RIFOXYA2_FULL_47_53]OGS26300.1 MAG: hypothetical protein A2339_02860 [Elusimicrobia bacterium RIFOXYB12_FULL_50_12]OGS29188.1 MAG: hypothetical protein A2323_04945 [Elusimicrobia bacterium RIFOXYB2_FULL_46_23]HBU69339.1 metallophosphoesterase [
MLFGIFSDIHSNLEALEVVLNFFKSYGVENYILAGDIVGYGPNPNECVNIVKKLPNLTVVTGNHDRAACGMKETAWFNGYASKSIEWTRAKLTQSNQIYLSELPKQAFIGVFCVVHGSPADNLDEYMLTKEQYAANIQFIKKQFTVVGHTHMPLIFTGNHPDGIVPKNAKPGRLYTFDESENNIIFNPGAAGQPRDSDSRASCAVFDTEKLQLEYFRMEYDITTTQEKMRSARLPAFLIERLSWGK